ncbi:MAG: V-type ATPase subunit [Oscillospiraceae bacterium]|nr:V-type ATPase subunit [Oscillospiraceae bacterium]
MAKTKKIREEDLVTLSAVLRAREARLLTGERAERMIETGRAEDAAKLLEECGYRDMSGLGVFGIEDTLSARRAELYAELVKTEAAEPVARLFMLKYDYHNVKALVKSMGANEDATRILSESGRVGSKEITDAFISGERKDLPPTLSRAMSEGVGTLSRTSNPQLSDLTADRLYYAEMTETAEETGDELVRGYVRLVIDAANLRTFVRSVRTGRTREFLASALFEGGDVPTREITELPYGTEAGAGEKLPLVFRSDELRGAVEMAFEALAGAAQTAFERECDNALQLYTQPAKLISFGAPVVLRYLLAFDWEATAVRMILSGLLAGVEPVKIRERMRSAYV